MDQVPISSSRTSVGGPINNYKVRKSSVDWFKACVVSTRANLPPNSSVANISRKVMEESPSIQLEYDQKFSALQKRVERVLKSASKKHN